MTGFIPPEIYTSILEHTPIPCVDLIVMHKGKVLMLFREMEPAKHEWFFPGGRVFKGEILEDTVKRKAREELGIEIEIVGQVGVYQTIFDTAALPGVKTGTHTVNAVFLVKPVDSEPEIKIDKSSSKFKWFDKIQEEWHPYLKESLKDAGFTSQ